VIFAVWGLFVEASQSFEDVPRDAETLIAERQAKQTASQ
jgi:hypothetical protein